MDDRMVMKTYVYIWALKVASGQRCIYLNTPDCFKHLKHLLICNDSMHVHKLMKRSVPLKNDRAMVR